MKIVVAFDQVIPAWITTAPVINRDLGVKAAAAQAYGSTAVARGGITVPYVWTPYVVTLAVESCICSVE